METMDTAAFAAALQKAFTENGVGKLLNYERVQAFAALTAHMLEENEKYNLTAIRETGKIILLHYVDCAVTAQYLPHGARVIDVGCGAGFPTLPLAIVRPDLQMVAMDATEKKVHYVTETAARLGLTNVEGCVLRAEDGGKDPAMREQFDIAIARAVAELRLLAELCLPFVRPGGEMIAMKGKNAAFELADAKKALAILGGRSLGIDETPLKSVALGDQGHAVIRIAKEKKTPPAYPRVYAQISKKTL